MLDTLFLFTDGSVNTQTGTGYGAYLAITKISTACPKLANQIRTKNFENTSSTKLELQTLLWALSEIQTTNKQIVVYTDCQSILRLPGRRERLEKNNYRSNNDKALNNAALYQAFFKITDLLDCEFIKVKGHLKSNKKNNIDQLFSLVDRAARTALRAA